ncbi:MAG: amino acid adenylation domain-containing protein, partial [Enterobacteriaceae bacterium]
MAHNLAYVIYTSGSTGKPKGVAVSHGALLNCLLWVQQRYLMTPQDRILQKTPYSFDVSVCELFWPLICGATLVIAKPGGHQDPSYLAQLTAQSAITFLQFVPPMLEAFLSECHRWHCPSLRQIICIGQALSKESVIACNTALPHVVLYNLYGPTETTIYATDYRCQAETALSTVPVGYPIANIRLYILDKHLNPVPVGVPGELYIAGAGLARGYLQRPELTAEKFIADPFSKHPGERMYASGDLARYLPEGSVEFMGRLDHQVKIRGVRIETGETESVLLTLPQVAQAVVVPCPGVAGEELVAYLVATSEGQSVPLTRTELQQALSACLPRYMVPAHFVWLEKLPLTPNGKLDRAALPAPDRTARDKEFIAPRTPEEQLLATLWSELLQQPHISVQDDFFVLGGHSLLAMQLISRLRMLFAVELPLQTLFAAPVLEQQAQQIVAAQRAQKGELLPAIVPRQQSQTVPLSHAQQRLWLLQQLSLPAGLYNIPLLWQLEGDINRDALQRSLDEILHRHEVLRTTFAQTEEGAVQHIAASLTWPLLWQDFSSEPLAQGEELCQQQIMQTAATDFCLQQGPLIAGGLFKLAPNRYRLLLVLHHIIADGWSVSLLTDELSVLYSACVQGESAALPALPVQYADYACWQRACLSEEKLAQQISYWRQQLAGLPPQLTLPTDYPRPAVLSYRGDCVYWCVDAQLTAALQQLSREQHCTLFMTLSAALSVLLSRYAGQEDIAIGTPVAGRQCREVEPLIGFFVNTLVLRYRLQGNPRFSELLQQTREMTLAAYAHQEVSFAELVSQLNPERQLSYSPLFQVMLAVQNQQAVCLELEGIRGEELALHLPVAKFDLTLSLMEREGVLQGEIEYSSDLFSRESIERMMGHFTTLLRGIVAAPETATEALPLLDKTEQQQIVVEWNRTEVEYLQEAFVHQRVTQQALTMPDRVALEFATETLSYGELERLSGQLAQALQAQGVGPESRVAVCMERSFEMVLSLLAILRAGGAYVPLDPEYPAQRLAYMLEDSQPVLLLTQKGVNSALPVTLPVLYVDCRAWQYGHYSETAPHTPLVAHNLAYVIYTSGSTGKPKGTLLTHGGLYNLIQAQIAQFDITCGQRVMQFASCSFDAAISEIFMTLTTGATLCIAGYEQLMPGQELTQTLQQLAVTTITLPPVALDFLSPEEVPLLSVLIVAGGLSHQPTLNKWISAGRRVF